MKKIIAALLALCFLIPALAACSSGIAETEETASPTEETATAATETAAPVDDGRTVSKPMAERPNYALEAGATPQQMRETAIRAQHDELSVLWFTDENITYGKTGAGEGKTFLYTPYETYGGLPYTNGTVGLFHWLEYYDFETGRMVGLPKGESLNSTLGNSCAASVMWGWSSCVNSITWTTTMSLNVAHGAIRVGPYTYDDSITDFTKYPTADICNANGEQVMYESYAAMHAGDALVTCGNAKSGHARMAISEPVVVRKDGKIDGAESYVYIQEQTSGIFQTSSDYIKTEDGERHHYIGRTSVKVTFAKLFASYYLPHTCAEFLGLKPYDLPGVTLSEEVTDLESLQSATVKSVYKLCVIYIKVYDQNGNLAHSRRSMTTSGDLKERAFDYPVSRLSISPSLLARNLTKGTPYTMRISALDASGSTFDVLSLDFTL